MVSAGSMLDSENDGTRNISRICLYHTVFANYPRSIAIVANFSAWGVLIWVVLNFGGRSKLSPTLRWYGHGHKVLCFKH